MRVSTIIVFLSAALVSGCTSSRHDNRIGVQTHDPGDYMFVSGAGQKAWYSALELEQVARRHVDEHKIEFQFDGTEKHVWVKTDDGRVLADVYYSSGIGHPILHVSIDRTVG